MGKKLYIYILRQKSNRKKAKSSQTYGKTTEDREKVHAGNE